MEPYQNIHDPRAWSSKGNLLKMFLRRKGMAGRPFSQSTPRTFFYSHELDCEATNSVPSIVCHSFLCILTCTKFQEINSVTP